MPSDIYSTFVDYEEAQELMPIFEAFRQQGPWADVRRSAKRILRELERIRDIEYEPSTGKQIVLSREDWQFLTDVMYRKLGHR